MRYGCGLDCGRPGRVRGRGAAGRPLRRRTGIKGRMALRIAGLGKVGPGRHAQKVRRGRSGTRACAKSRAARTGSWPRRTAGSWRRGPRGRRCARAAPPKPAAPPEAADARMPIARGTGKRRRGGAALRSAPQQSRRRPAAPADRGRGRHREGCREPVQYAAPASSCRPRRHGRGAERTWPAASRGAAEPCGRSLTPSPFFGLQGANGTA